MARGLSITEARQRLLTLPDLLHAGEGVEIHRHRQPVMKLIRLGPSAPADPFAILDAAMQRLPAPRRRAPRALARGYKRYLYGKKG